ncbi:hypothetical protein IFM51744_02525 [Aspergillus udagawae]|uniref:Uncharacterized protein n=1 Tax=Aspergillus udagawae TaxID=91492 RepID=A0ABQ1ACP9_9EURO|nr:hypothetical protein IFM51744_02525 [Aspergillus udagawae]GFF78985.1 hypothetical protein IFM53868_02481 [Aspergillus udagawae]GFG07808.1 hypothetical protein IFM5058_03606 [Aspergillus udagawae]
MKFLGLAVALLPFLAAAAPVADPEAEAVGELDLEKRASAQTCKIVNVDHYVNCRYDAKLSAGEIFGFPKGEKFTFACWKHGDCFNGVCSWDQITYLGTTCYVNGYFTDSNCSSKKLPKCK